MILLYSGLTNNQPSSPEKSLGGCISSTQVNNSVKGNLFSVITKRNTLQGIRDTRLLVLKNTTGSTVATFNIYTTVDTNSLFRLKVGLVAPALNTECDFYYFEKIEAPSQLPLQTSLIECEGIGNKIVVNTPILSQKYVGIWVTRELKVAPTQQNISNSFSGTDEAIQELRDLSLPFASEEFNITVGY